MTKTFYETDGGRKAAGYKCTKAFGGDCVVRSISIALDQPYNATFMELMELGMEMGGFPDMPPVYEAYLQKRS